jgi:uncharacterized delta-60 repeat protein
MKHSLTLTRAGGLRALAKPHGCAATFVSALVLFLASANAANMFQNTGSLANGRQSHTATLLHSGKVLVAGGHVGFNPAAAAELYDPATGVWTGTGALGTARYAHTATLLPNGKVLVAGGYNSSGNTVASAELYDPATGNWSATGNLATNRAFHTATLLANGKVLIVGGTDGNLPLVGAELYEPATGTWSATGSLMAARRAHTATPLPNGKVLAAGGTDGFGTFFTSAELYDPDTGNWTGTGALTGGRAHHTACLLPNGKVLAAGGQTTGFSALTSAQLYDPATGVWSSAGALATACYGHTATVLPNGNVLIAGGQTTGGGFLANAQIYESATGLWLTVPSINLFTARAFHSATVLAGGKVLFAGGVTSGNTAVASAELYDSAAGSWGTTGFLKDPRYAHTATLLSNGKVLLVGGTVYPGQPTETELYDPATGAWSVTGPLSTSRISHTATLLPSGKVLVAGGHTNTVASAELYDSVTGNWTITGPLGSARQAHTATLLPNGKVLVVGGVLSVAPYALASAELYDPATGAWTNTGALSTPRGYHTATLLPNGKVLVAGAVTSSTSAELYDPVTGNWTSTGSMGTPRSAHTATLLPNGKVLVTGGDGIGTSAELYDPATATWSATGSHVSAHTGFYYPAVLLPNGKVLIAGGDDISGEPVATAELYDPATGTWSATASLPTARDTFTLTLLPNGKVLCAAGQSWNANGSLIVNSTELYDAGLGFDETWRPQITSASFDVAGRLVLKGAGFRGITSASGGNGSQDSPTSYPVVQLRRLDNGQTSFVLSEPATPVSATRFTSVPTSALTPGHALVGVFANGIPSAAFPVLIGFPSIAVELPNGTVIPDGGTHSFISVLGTPANLNFTIRNIGSVNLTGLSITKDGPNAADFTLTLSPTSPVVPSGSTTFTIQFAPANTTARTATLHIANNVAAFHPYDIALTGQALELSFTQDTDGDGMSDAAEVQLAAQGFDWQVSQPALVNAYYANANEAGLYTTNQIQALNVDGPLLVRNPTNGLFTLTIGVQKSTNLVNFNPFPMTAPQTLINGQGELEFQFTVPDDAAFFRLEAH